jgi:hypothetical protein
MGDALDASEQALMNFEVAPIHESFMQVRTCVCLWRIRDPTIVAAC